MIMRPSSHWISEDISPITIGLKCKAAEVNPFVQCIDPAARWGFFNAHYNSVFLLSAYVLLVTTSALATRPAGAVERAPKATIIQYCFDGQIYVRNDSPTNKNRTYVDASGARSSPSTPIDRPRTRLRRKPVTFTSRSPAQRHRPTAGSCPSPRKTTSGAIALCLASCSSLLTCVTHRSN